MVQVLDIEAFLAVPGVALDVRSPSEFSHAAIAGAHSLPLFTDTERAQVGTTYKQIGRDQAVELGLRLAGPRFADLVVNAKEYTRGQAAKVYCWRGGMRSGAVAWLLETAGLQAITLKGGYKQYRRRALSILDKLGDGPPITILGGMTGSGKTAILQALKQRGEQILDLEELASHRGSTYGGVGMPPQPSTEHFENEIARLWSQFDPHRRVWIEDESRQIGQLRLPLTLFKAMLEAPVFLVERPKEERVTALLEAYGQLDRQHLLEATQRLNRRLGGERTEQVLCAIAAGNMIDWIELVLDYYDGAYKHALKRRSSRPVLIAGTGLSPETWAENLQQA